MAPRKRKLFIDMDGILVDIYTNWLERYNNDHGTVFGVRDITDYDIAKITGPSVYNYLAEPGFFIDLDPLPGAIEAFKAIQESNKYDTYIVSTPAYGDSASDKIMWCKEHLSLSKNRVILMAQKDMLYQTTESILIDDKPDNLRRWTGRTLSIKWPYNEGMAYDGYFLANDYRDTENAWRQLLGKLGV